ncbi:MAG: hypothetical protein Q8L22_26295 [Reyranella sp.]|nr:hypothetical protein [Reyranella sp.]
MDKSTDLVAVNVPKDDVDLYSVTESGWYAVDDEDKAVLGPFMSLGECDRAIHDRVALVAQTPSSGTGAHVT